MNPVSYYKPYFMMNCHTSAFFVTWIYISFLGALGESPCPSPQYLELGRNGIIRCSFQEGFFVLHWYNSENILHDDAILILQGSLKSGKGFDSGEYDVYLNGSLIINNVTRNHEHTFTALIVETQSALPARIDVNVVIIAQTFSHRPRITECDNASEICLQALNPNGEISCYVRDARSVVPLTWMVRTINGDRNTSYHTSITNRTFFYTSRITTKDPFLYTTMLALLVCKVHSPTVLLEKNESLVMLQNKRMNDTNVKRKSVYLELGEKLSLNCSNIQTSYHVWQLNRFDDKFVNVLYAYIMEETFVHKYNDDYSLEGNCTLVVNDVRVKHEGVYRCTASNGIQDDVMTYDVVVFTTPSPAYPIVQGCSHEQYCVLEIENEGSLKCTVHGIRPTVQLHVGTFYDSFSKDIEFFEQQTTIKDNGDAFDVSLISKYRVKNARTDRITIECKVIGEFPHRHELSTKFDILLLTGAVHPSGESFHPTDETQADEQYIWIIIIVLGFLFVFIVLGGALGIRSYQKRKKSRRAGGSNEVVASLPSTDVKMVTHRYGTDKMKEHPVRRKSLTQNVSPEEEMMIPKSNFPDKEQMLIGELKLKYEVLYDAVQPIPYIRDRLYCVDRVFVEGGIEYLVTMEMIGGQGSWKDLETYQNLFNDERIKSTRRILEGEPGYGKSTLTLQLAYDWCNKIDASALSKVDILILLRLRQLGGVKSIYRAIKQFLLPKDSTLTEKDIEDILRNSSSVVVVLDGFDEYPDQGSGNESDVIDIIMKKMFQQFDVILTTRSSYLPKYYPPQTKRIKLTGFDDRARDQYIRKAVAHDDEEAVETTKRRLKENAILAGLCQVPLFFVMFAHMSHESEHFQKFNSVTSFFRYMISCFHSHMTNKMKDDNVKNFVLFEADHQELDKVAFEGLSGKEQKIVWKKQELFERVGQDLYDQYVRIGILVEEDVLSITDNPSSVISEHIKYQTEVRFYHKLFCEWYAAHYLAEYASKDEVTLDQLRGRAPPLLEGLFEYDEPFEHEQLFHTDFQENIPDDRFVDDLYQSQDDMTKNEDHVLENLDPVDLQYLYRFTCGLNPVAGEKIIQYLKRKNDGEKFAILCILEQEGKIENLLKTIQQLCSSDVNISQNDSLLLQRSTIQLLEIASSNEIAISSVLLDDCFQSVDLKEESLCLSSGLQLPRLDTLQQLVIYFDYRKEDLRDKASDVLDYSARCVALKSLKFTVPLGNILLPQSFDDRHVLASLYSKNCKVQWKVWINRKRVQVQLNLQTGKWEKEDGQEMTDDEYRVRVGYHGVVI